jgi:hypothetical protein
MHEGASVSARREEPCADKRSRVSDVTDNRECPREIVESRIKLEQREWIKVKDLGPTTSFNRR